MCVPVCELKNKSSRLYPSSFRLSQSMKLGFGEPGNVGIDSEIVSVRSMIFIKIDNSSHLINFQNLCQVK